jgi:tRNA dimethylallyltransferase
VVLVYGPTAVGKSELAVELAESWHGEIIGADSVQVYRDLDKGSAKPVLKLRERIQHHLIDLVDIGTKFTAETWLSEASARIAEIHAREALPVVVGGTGLYFKALIHGLSPGPASDSELRRQLELRLLDEGNERLHDELTKLDPVAGPKIHPNDSRRVVRALEVWYLTGRPLSWWWGRQARESSYSFIHAGVSDERSRVYARIDQRCRSMLDAGLLEETQALMAQGWDATLPSAQALGYRECRAVLNGELRRDELEGVFARNTRRFAKRQWTLFRHLAGCKLWGDPDTWLHWASAQLQKAGVG